MSSSGSRGRRGQDVPGGGPGPRCPAGGQEAFAWGFMLGYLGQAPDALRAAFDGYLADDDAPVDSWGSQTMPSFLEQAGEGREFMRGYEAGVATYSDHACPQDRDASEDVRQDPVMAAARERVRPKGRRGRLGLLLRPGRAGTAHVLLEERAHGIGQVVVARVEAHERASPFPAGQGPLGIAEPGT